MRRMMYLPVRKVSNININITLIVAMVIILSVYVPTLDATKQNDEEEEFYTKHDIGDKTPLIKTTNGDSAADQHRPARHSAHCAYDNRRYRPGELFTPSPCTSCECPPEGGPVRCSYVQCHDDPHCITYDRTHVSGRQCCPQCMERGCHYRNHTYTAGTRIPTGLCEVCYCPWEGGEARCVKHECQPAQCVDAVVEPGKCCPQCPKGSNCKLGRFTLHADTVYHINKCLSCMCRKVAPSAPPRDRVARCWKKTDC